MMEQLSVLWLLGSQECEFHILPQDTQGRGLGRASAASERWEKQREVREVASHQSFLERKLVSMLGLSKKFGFHMLGGRHAIGIF